MSNTSYRRLDELLEKRPLPFKFGQVRLGLAKQIPTPGELEQLPNDEDIIIDTDESNELDEMDKKEETADIDKIPDVKNTVVSAPIIKLVDKRKSSMLDRLAVLKRIQNKKLDTVDTSAKADEKPIDPTIISSAITVPVLTDRTIDVKKPGIKSNETVIIDAVNTAAPIIPVEEIITEPDEEIITEPVKKPRKLKLVGKKEVTEHIEEVDLTTAVIRTQKVIDRLPKEREKVNIKAPSYYMNNRKIFVQKMAEIFAPYQADLQDVTSKISCDTQSTGDAFDLLTHQKIVRDYLNIYTPYRGLLLYHGLGSGKTCTSIAIAEGMKSDKRVFVMTPASLKMNFFSEMKKCGDELYKKNQYWEFISIEGNPTYVGILSRALSLSSQYITENGGAWLVNINKEPNYTMLSVPQQTAVDEQLNAMIRSKYTDINYNGLNERKMKDLTGDYSRNPFDNAVVIIDEAHNFVSRIVNKIKVPNSLSYKLYHYLLSASNAKIVLLTGTPIINYPNEISILYNILRGYIKTWTIPISWEKTEKLNKDTILSMLDDANLKSYDYVNYSDNKLTITRNPYGFINTKKRGTLHGTKRAPIKMKADNNNKTRRKQEGGNSDVFDRYNGVRLDESGNITDSQFLESVLRVLKSKKNEISVKDSLIEEINHKGLPDDRDAFFANFIDADQNQTKNINVFQRRILGLTSYFRSAQEELLPSFDLTENGDTYHIVKTPMTPHQFGIYEKIRKEEADREKKSTKMKRMRSSKADELYNVSSTYRIFSRAACNFTFPSGIERPVPGLKMGDDADDIDEKALDNIVGAQLDYEGDMQDQAVDDVIDTTYAKRIEAVMEQINRKIEGTEMSEYLSKDALPEYSPKFAKVLENIMDTENRGLHLLYSHFRTIEGIGIMRLILLANGMAEFRLKREGEEWVLDIAEEDMDKPKFVLYTGTETAEEKEIIRNVYNGTWGFVPQPIVDELRKHAENNIYGEVIKMIMITSSGAEGINLRNTRFVHIIEPYWHMVRVEQVVGRARRICSHQDLPEDLRTVKVFLYISTLSEQQRTDERNVELRIRDISRVDKKTPVTTDETLYEIASSKQRINNEILRAIKETAVDCNIYSGLKQGANAESYVCYGYGLVESNNFSSYPSFDVDSTVKEGLDIKTVNWKGVKKTIDGISYALNPKTNQLYDLDSFKRAQQGQGQPIYVGQYTMQNGIPMIIRETK